MVEFRQGNCVWLTQAKDVVRPISRCLVRAGKIKVRFFCLTLAIVLSCLWTHQAEGNDPLRVPILVYHRFGPVVADSMTVTTPVFEAHLRYLQDNAYTVIPLRQLVAYYLGGAPQPPPRSVVITVDDAHRSVYSQMLPLVRRYHVPVTMFVYPSAISNASYALRWEQLQELRATGLFDIQSHTYWHPNFKKEKQRLSPEQYRQFVEKQLRRAKDTLESRLGVQVDLLSWPFGIYNDELIAHATAAGYVAAVTLDRRPATPADRLMALPRYLMTDADRGKRFARLVAGLE
jgi:peptidoglycan/xylan/chitin deacetylase (PgdA/CDA1 family)